MSQTEGKELPTIGVDELTGWTRRGRFRRPRATKLIFENGERTLEADRRITRDAAPGLGKFLNFEKQPKAPAALQGVLRDKKHRRERLKSGDIKEHIETLSGKGKEKKPSLRAQLTQDKNCYRRKIYSPN